MSFKLLNRVRMSLTGAAGTGTLPLNLAALGFQDFVAAGLQSGDTTPYLLESGSPIGATWEIGVGTYHSNGTFTRDLVTMSSAGGTTKISALADAILSAVFRAEDLSQASTPVMVQYKVVQATMVGDVNVTLNAAPTTGNWLVFMACGGGSTSGGYTTGVTLDAADKAEIINDQFLPSYGVRSARPSEASTFKLGAIGAGGPPFIGVVVEVSGLDITKFTTWMANIGRFTTTLSEVQALTTVGALMLAFGGGDNVTITSVNPASYTVNNSDGSSRAIFYYATSGGDWFGINGQLGSAGNFGVCVLNLPGV